MRASIVKWLRENRPPGIARYVMPYLIVVLTVISIATVNITLENRAQTNDVREQAAKIRTLTQEARDLATSLQSAVVEACEDNGAALRRVTRETLQEKIHNAENPRPGLVAALGLPREKVEGLLQGNIAKLRARLALVAPIDCAEQYHIGPGSGERRRDSSITAP